MRFKVIRGSRSEKFAAKAWICEKCGNLNELMEFLLFDVPHLYCQNRDCLSQFTGVVYFCVGDIEVNGYSVLPEIKNQGLKPECIPYALCSAEEYNGIIEKIVMGQDPSVDELDPDDLANQYKDMFPMMGNCSRVQGLHKLLYSGLILKKYGCRTVKGGGRKPSGSDLVAVVEARYEDILHLIADGRAIVAVISTKKKFHELQFGKVYSQPLDGKTVEHAVMLVGALITPDQRIYMFMNSHGREFCSLLNSEGEIVAGGIGMVFTDMPCNVIVFSRSWEEGTFGKLSGSWRTDLTSDELVAEVELLQEPFRRANSTFVDKDFNSGGSILACCYEAVDDINISMNQMRIMDLLNLNNICVLHTKSILSFCLQGNIKDIPGFVMLFQL